MISMVTYFFQLGYASLTAISNTGWALKAWSQGIELNSNVLSSEAVIVDLFDTTASQIRDYRLRGHTVICYYSAGTAEEWREDVQAVPARWEAYAVGSMQQWGGEVWLDVRQLEGLKALMTPRLDLAVQKGCDGVEPDNVDCFANLAECKLPNLSSAQEARTAQVAYNSWTARAAHDRGLKVGLKNAGGLVADLVALYDFAVVEQCLQYSECNVYAPFNQANKLIWGIEYKALSATECNNAVNTHHVMMKYCDGSPVDGVCNGRNLINCYPTPAWPPASTTTPPTTTTTPPITTTAAPTTLPTTTTPRSTTTPPTTTTPLTTTTPPTLRQVILYPSSVQVVKGTISVGCTNLARLAVQTTSPGWDDYVEHYPSSGQHVSEYSFKLPDGVLASSVRTAALTVNWMGPAKAAAAWSWQLIGQSADIVMGDNGPAPDWSWKAWSMAIQTAPGALPANNVLKIRMSASTTDDCDLDFMRLTLQYHSLESP
eukprot:g9748.t1